MQKAISVRLEKEYLVLLRQLRETKGQTVNRAINTAVREYLSREYGTDEWRLWNIAASIAPEAV